MTPRLVFVDLRHERFCRMDAPSVPTVLCLGNFDGVHVAHAALLREGVRLKAHLSPDARCGVFCFFRPSVDFFGDACGRGGMHLSSLREKLRLFAAEGVDFACLCDFPSVRGLSPDEFMDMLAESVGCRGVVCGYNYRFGACAKGTADMIAARFDRPEAGLACTVMPRLDVDGETVSSSRIRALLREGDVSSAARLLGRRYAVESTVVHGKRLGRKMGFPTANQHFLKENLVPRYGVYATLCHTPAGTLAGVSNVGVRPTVEGGDRGLVRANCETHIMGVDQDLYGQRIRVEFVEFLREEKRFESVEALSAAIADDAGRALTLVAHLIEAKSK